MTDDETLPPEIRMPQARNAIKDRTCGTCRHFHNPDGGFMGCCVRFPPTMMMIGMQIRQGSFLDPKKPPQQDPVFMAKFPFVYVKDGCGEHVPTKGADDDQQRTN